MKVTVGTFARSGIEARFGTDVPACVQTALLHYTRRLKSGWPPVGVPRFRRDEAPASRVAADTFEVSVAPETEAALKREACRHQVPVDQVLVHAVLVYLADLDSAPGD